MYEGLNPVFASRLRAMIGAAAAEGKTIGVGSGFRTVQEQIELRKRNGCPDVWSSPASACRVPTAIPGRSNHNRGLAADLTGDKEWANANAHRFGLAFTVSGEDWHVELADGHDIPGGPNPEWATESRNPEDELISRLDMIMGVLVGENAETPLPEVPADVTPEPAEPAGAASVAAGSGNAFGDYALARFDRYGWDPSELEALTRLWNRESGDPEAADITWNPEADNPDSPAAGIAQKLQSVHGPVEEDWQGQIDWGLGYIAQRYGSPSRALAFHDRNGWY